MVNLTSIGIRDLLLKADQKCILDIPSANLPIERITVVLGANGAGKTSLLKAIAGLIEVPLGSIELPFESTLMVLNQSTVLKMSVRKNLMLLQDASRFVNAALVQDAMQKFHLIELSEAPATHLSSGERQRLALARAYLMDAQLVLLDEPTASLDPNTTRLIERYILDMTQDGTKFLMVSHDLMQIQRLSEHTVFLQGGRIQSMLPTAQFFDSPEDVQINDFIRYLPTKNLPG